MKTIHENLPLPDPNLCRWNKKKKKKRRRKKKISEKKKSDESIRHHVLRTGCLIRIRYTYTLHLHRRKVWVCVEWIAYTLTPTPKVVSVYWMTRITVYIHTYPWVSAFPDVAHIHVVLQPTRWSTGIIRVLTCDLNMWYARRKCVTAVVFTDPRQFRRCRHPLMGGYWRAVGWE